MLVAVVEKPGKLVIKDVPKPEVTDDTYIIKVEAASICNATDNHIVEGIFDGYHDHYPQILGHEVCGTVVEIGKDVDNVRLGERVALYTPNGAFAEYVPVHKHSGIAHIRDDMPSEVAAICETFDGSYTGLVGPAMLQKDEKVLITGAGPLGLAATGTSSQYTENIAVIDFYENRLAMAREMGAKWTYNRSEMTSDEILEAIRRDIGEIDTAFMCIALDRSKELDAFYIPIEALKYNGRMAGVNVEVQLKYHNHRLNPFHMNRKNIKYRHFLERNADGRDFQTAFDMVADKKFDLGKEITHRVTLDKLEWALDMTHNHLDECIKIVVYPRIGE